MVGDVSVLFVADYFISCRKIARFNKRSSAERALIPLTIFGLGFASDEAGSGALVRAVVNELHLVIVGSQLLADGLKKWILAGSAVSAEVVHVGGVNHHSAKALLLQPSNLNNFGSVTQQ